MYLPLEQWSPIPGDGRDTTENGSTCHDWLKEHRRPHEDCEVVDALRKKGLRR